jgi:RimJ/RimL family protein N-acetyltransferase
VIYKLDPADYERVRPLFRALEFHLTSAAVLDGHNPGRVFVDDPTRPQSAFMFSPEGCYLAGRPDNDEFNRALSQALLKRHIIHEQVEALYLICTSASWEDQLPTLFAPHRAEAIARRHYVCRQLTYDWRANLSSGLAVHRIDEVLLNRPDVSIPAHITGWIEGNWGSTADFLERGFGSAMVYTDAAGAMQVVAWSVADCRSGDACEIGIRTVEPYRRRGLATITAAATVEYALAHGFSMVGWQCSENNLGSLGTANKVGFERERNYTLFYTNLKGQRA